MRLALLFCLLLTLVGLAQAPETADQLLPRMLELVKKGSLKEAIPLAERILQLTETARGPDHPDSAAMRNNLAELYFNVGEDGKAIQLYELALPVLEKAHGQIEGVGRGYMALGVCYEARGEFGKGEAALLRASTILEKSASATVLADALCFLGRVQQAAGKYALAEQALNKALAIHQKVAGPTSADAGVILNQLGLLYRDQAAFGKAEEALKQARSISERLTGPESVETSAAINNLAQLYSDMARYAEAEELYQRARVITEKALGPRDVKTAMVVTNLATLYISTGAFVQAKQLLLQTIPILEQACGPKHPTTATALNNLGFVHEKLREYAEGEAIYRKVLAIREECLGPRHPDTAHTLNDLAEIHRQQKNFAAAEPLFLRALSIWEEVLGPEHPITSVAVNNLAILYHSQGEYAKAEPLYVRALAIAESKVGPEHAETATVLENLARLRFDLGQQPASLELARRCDRARGATVAKVFSFTSEKQRLAFQASWQPYSLFGALGSAPDLARCVLRYKGLVLDSMVEDQRAALAGRNPELAAQVARLRQASERLMQLSLQSSQDSSRSAQVRQLEAEVEQGQAALARATTRLGQTRRALSVSADGVQKALPRESALVEFLRYSHNLGKNDWEERYGAVVLPPQGVPTWVPLGPARELEDAVAVYQARVRGQDPPSRAVRLPATAAGPGATEAILRLLYDRVWGPIQAALPAGTTMVILSPDAQLNFVSFATLVSPQGHFLGEDYVLAYVASGRDLLAAPRAQQKPGMVVFANPDFGTALTNGAAVAARRDVAGIRFEPLPGTANESQQLAELASRTGTPYQAYQGREATEASVHKVGSPRILHLATHGFFLPEVLTGTEGQTQIANPMQRSGVALSGAQATIDAWLKGQAPPPEADGILTAQEVGGLDLTQTWLVCLSACDTGTGEARAGEGVLGLRRGFVQAGAENLLITLWPVADRETAAFMNDFHQKAAAGGNAAQALAEVQREWLVRLRKERSVAAAASLAGPFVLTFQGAAPK